MEYVAGLGKDRGPGTGGQDRARVHVRRQADPVARFGLGMESLMPNGAGSDWQAVQA